MQTATLNRLAEQDWSTLITAAAKGLLFTSHRVRLPNGKTDEWLSPEPVAYPASSSPIKDHAFELAHHAICEVHKRVGRAAMDGDDEGPSVATVAPAYKALFEALDANGKFTSLDSPPVVLTALRDYRAAIGKLVTLYLDKQGPKALIWLGNIEPRED
jgi:hypothetical protein